jgi:uncharacterized repeat protein (TIGR01451 family)
MLQRVSLEILEDRTLPSISTTSALIAAIHSANSSGTSTTLTLAPGVLFNFVAADNSADGGNALPVITGNITIVGNNDILVRTGTDPYRLFDVATQGALTLQNLTLQGGLASFGGALYSAGTLNLNGVTVKNNTAQGSNGESGRGPAPSGNGGSGTDGIGGGLYVALGSVSLTNDILSSNTALGGNGGDSVNGYTGQTQAKTFSGGFGGSGGEAAGGGLYVASAGGLVFLGNDTFSGNQALGGSGGKGGNGYFAGAGGAGGGAAGGAIDVTTEGSITLSNDSFFNNAALGGPGGQGGSAGNGGFGGDGGFSGNGVSGGLAVSAGGDITLSNDTFAGNLAHGGDGGAGGKGGDGRSANGGPGGFGGGAANGVGGGLAVSAAGNINLSNDTLSGNTAQGGDAGRGGLGGKGASTTFGGFNGGTGGGGGSGGSALGGGLFVGSGTIYLTNDTVASNSARGGYGGSGGDGGDGGFGSIGVSPGAGGRGGAGGDGGAAEGGGFFVPAVDVASALANSLIAENGPVAGTGVPGGLGGHPGGSSSRASGGASGSDGNASGPDVSGSVLSSDHDLIGDPSGSSGFSTANGDILSPPFVGLDPNGLQNNGGPTQTIALVSSSAAIDRGDDNALGLPATDQRGFARIVGSAVDIGAFEFGATPVTANVVISGSTHFSGDAGGLITYTLTVRNKSASAQSNVSVADSMPADATLVSWTTASSWNRSAPPAGSSSGTVTAWIGSLAANCTAMFALVVRVSAATAVGTVISNTVSLAPAAAGSSSGTNSVSFNTAVLSAPTIQVDASGHLLIMGDGAGNQITLGVGTSGGVFVNFNGTLFPFGPGQVSSIEVETASDGGALETVLATPAAVPLTINAGGSGDAVAAGNQAGTVSSILGPLAVNGQGTTRFTVFDQGSTTVQTYTLTASTVTRSGGFAATYANVGSLMVNGASAPLITTYDIEGTAAGTPVVLNGGTGQDDFDVTPTGQDLDTLASLLTLNGGGGHNFLTVDDAAAPVAESFTVSPTSLSRSGSAGIRLSGMLSAEVQGGGHGNNFAVPSLLGTASFSLFVDCGSGGDTVSVGNATSGLDSLQDFLAVTDNFDLSTLVLDDRASSVTGRPYTIFGSEVLWGQHQLDYAGVGSLVLDVGSGRGDRVTYEESAAATTVNAGIGGDTVQTNGAVGLIGPGPLTINGVANTNTMFLALDQSATPETYTLTATPTGGEVLARSGGLVATCNTVHSLVIQGGNGGDQFKEIDPATTLVTCHGGSGINSLSATEGVGHFTGWAITGPGSGRAGGRITFTGMHDLVGTSSVDNFVFSPGGSIAGSIAGGSGPLGNILSYANEPGPVTVNMQTGAAPQIAGGAAGGFSGITIFQGSTSSANTLIGLNANTTWTLKAANGGAGIAGSYAFIFSGFQNLVGGAGLDVFTFTAGGSLSGSLNGGAAPVQQGNWLDYSALATPVTVNLQTGSATGVAGGVSNFQNVHGGNGGNTLTGNSQGNILIGGTGADTLTGGTGASLLIGGQGSDQVTGGSGNDILIGDAITFDAMLPRDEDALMAILAEWQSSDSYAVRFRDIDTGTGGGLNGTARLNFGTSVKDDGAADTVTAALSAKALNWFFQGAGDTLVNVQTSEHINNT